MHSSSRSGCEACSRPEELQPTLQKERSCASGLQKREVHKVRSQVRGCPDSVQVMTGRLLLQMHSSGPMAPAIVLMAGPFCDVAELSQTLQWR